MVETDVHVSLQNNIQIVNCLALNLNDKHGPILCFVYEFMNSVHDSGAVQETMNEIRLQKKGQCFIQHGFGFLLKILDPPLSQHLFIRNAVMVIRVDNLIKIRLSSKHNNLDQLFSIHPDVLSAEI